VRVRGGGFCVCVGGWVGARFVQESAVKCTNMCVRVRVRVHAGGRGGGGCACALTGRGLAPYVTLPLPAAPGRVSSPEIHPPVHPMHVSKVGWDSGRYSERVSAEHGDYY